MNPKLVSHQNFLKFIINGHFNTDVGRNKKMKNQKQQCKIKKKRHEEQGTKHGNQKTNTEGIIFYSHFLISDFACPRNQISKWDKNLNGSKRRNRVHIHFLVPSLSPSLLLHWLFIFWFSKNQPCDTLKTNVSKKM